MSRRIFRGTLPIDSFATDFTRRLVSSRSFALLANLEPHSSNTVLEMTYRGRLSRDICLPVLYKIVRETVQICPGCSSHNGQNIVKLNPKKVLCRHFRQCLMSSSGKFNKPEFVRAVPGFCILKQAGITQVDLALNHHHIGKTV